MSDLVKSCSRNEEHPANASTHDGVGRFDRMNLTYGDNAVHRDLTSSIWLPSYSSIPSIKRQMLRGEILCLVRVKNASLSSTSEGSAANSRRLADRREWVGKTTGTSSDDGSGFRGGWIAVSLLGTFAALCLEPKRRRRRKAEACLRPISVGVPSSGAVWLRTA